MRQLLVLAITLGGCKKGDDTGGSSDTTPVDNDSPTVTEVDAWCYEHTTGTTAYFWIVRASFTDPQGTDTVDRTGGIIRVYSGLSVVAEYNTLVCEGDGSCSGNFNQEYDDVLCSGATGYSIGITVVDAEGNASDEVSVTGRVASGPEG